MRARLGRTKVIIILLIPVSLLAILVLFGIGYDVLIRGTRLNREAQQVSEHIRAATALRQIGAAIEMYRQGSDNRSHSYPPSLQSLEDLKQVDLPYPLAFYLYFPPQSIVGSDYVLVC